MILPVELGAELTDAGIARLGDNAKVAATEIATRVLELRMVEDVEELRSDLDAHAFLNTSNFLQAQIGVRKPWSVEELPVSVAKSA